MEVKGAKGFDKVQYDPIEIGENIAENLLGVPEMKKLPKTEKAKFVADRYPHVMSFFKQHDLQPTLMNLRLNLEAIKQSVAQANAPAQPSPAPAAATSSFTGLALTTDNQIRKQEAYTIGFILLVFILIIFILS